MNRALEKPETPRPSRAHARAAWALSFVGLVVLAAGIVIAVLLYPSRIGPKQPIPFSHRVHAHDKKISCFLCHPGAHYSSTAGVPEVETCMLCHSKIIITYPQIEDLREHYFDSSAIAWVRVTKLPDYVYFDHSVHVQRGVDCGKCHGNVQGMDRIQLAHDLNMGFCVQCHRDNNATHDCFTCHR